MNSFMKYAIKEAQKALKKNNVPIGCVIVANNKIIAKAHNQAFWHAEILCIDKALKKISRLNQCTIYTTIEPCPMCLHAIKLAKIKTIIYEYKNKKNIHYKTEIIEYPIYEKSKELIQSFFINKRK